MGNLRQNPLIVRHDRAIVLSEANSCLPLEGNFQQMARRGINGDTCNYEGICG